MLSFMSWLSSQIPWQSTAKPKAGPFGRIPLEQVATPREGPQWSQEQLASLEETPRDQLDAFLHFNAWHPIVSSNIKAARYFPDESRMEVEFTNGNFYSVMDWSIKEAEDFITAASAGKWYWSNVRVRGKGNFWATRKPYVFLFGATPPQWLRSKATRKIHGIFTRAGAGGVRRQKVMGKSISKILAPRQHRGMS